MEKIPPDNFIILHEPTKRAATRFRKDHISAYYVRGSGVGSVVLLIGRPPIHVAESVEEIDELLI